MPTLPVTNLGGLNLGVNPLLQNQGEFTRLVNVDSEPVGAKKKRAGYSLFGGTADGSAVTNLFEWHKDDGINFNVYRFSGSQLYYSAQGTTDWQPCQNANFTPGVPVGNAILNNAMIIGNGLDLTRHTTDGVNFINTSGAPLAARFVDYQNRIYAAGTGSLLFFSSTGDVSNWQLAGTSDSSSLVIPGPGKLIDVFKVSDTVITNKNSGLVHLWDGNSLTDTATQLGYSSPYSAVKIEDFKVGLNRLGYFAFNGGKPQIISNNIKSQIYNDRGSAIVGTVFDNAPAGVYRYQYMCSVGSVTDDFTNTTISNCLQVYNFQLDEWSNYSFGTRSTSFVSYKDNVGNNQMMFGDNSGQCYLYGGTALSDNGLPIQSIMQFIYHDGSPSLEKEFNYIWLFFNPGCQAKVQVAVGDTYGEETLTWYDIGDVSSGVGEYHFARERGRLLFIKITESSTDSRFTFYGCGVDYDPIGRK